MLPRLRTTITYTYGTKRSSMHRNSVGHGLVTSPEDGVGVATGRMLTESRIGPDQRLDVAEEIRRGTGGRSRGCQRKAPLLANNARNGAPKFRRASQKWATRPPMYLGAAISARRQHSTRCQAIMELTVLERARPGQVIGWPLISSRTLGLSRHYPRALGERTHRRNLTHTFLWVCIFRPS